MSDNQYDMEAFLGDLENQIDNWDAAKESVGSKGNKEFPTISEGEHIAQFDGELRTGKDKNNNPYMAVPFIVTGGDSAGVQDSFFFSFNPAQTNDKGVAWGYINSLNLLEGLGTDISGIASLREIVEIMKALLESKQQFILRAKKKGNFMNYYAAGVISEDAPSGPQQGDEVMFKLGKINTKGSYEHDNGDGTHAVKVGNKLHPKVTLVSA